MISYRTDSTYYRNDWRFSRSRTARTPLNRTPR